MADQTIKIQAVVQTTGLTQAVDQSGNVHRNLNAATQSAKQLEAAANSAAGALRRAAQSAPKGAASAMASAGNRTSAPVQAAQAAEVVDYNRNRSVGVGTGASARDFANQAQGLGGLVKLYATFAANIFAVSSAFNVLKDAADTTNLMRGLDALGASSGRSLGGLAKQLTAASDGAISLREAMSSVAVTSSAGLSNRQILQLGEVAKNASVALGVSMPDAITRLSRGIVKLEPELLDELGLFTKIEPAVEAYARQLGKTATQLTDFERRQAFANAVLKEGTDKFKEVSGLSANAYDKFLASLKNVAFTGLELLNKVLVPIVDVLGNSPSALSAGILAIIALLIKQAIPAVSDFRAALGVKFQDEIDRTKKKLEELNYTYKVIGEQNVAVAQKKADSLMLSIAAQEQKLTEFYAKASKQSGKLVTDPRVSSQIGVIEPDTFKQEDLLKMKQAQAEMTARYGRSATDMQKEQLKLQQQYITTIEAAMGSERSLAEAIEKTRTTELAARGDSTLSARLRNEQNELERKNQVSAIAQTAGMRAATLDVGLAYKALKADIELAGDSLTKADKNAAMFKGTLAIASSIAGKLFDALGKLLNWFAVGAAGFAILDAIFSKNEKQMQAFTQSIDLAKESVLNITRTLLLLEQAGNSKTLLENSIAISNAMREVSESAKKLVFDAEIARKASTGMFDSIIEKVKSLFNQGIDQKLATNLTNQILGTFKLLQGTGLSQQYQQEIKALLNIENLSFNEIREAILLSNEDIKNKVLERLDAMNAAVNKQRSALEGFKDASDKALRSYEEFIQSTASKDPLFKLGSSIQVMANEVVNALSQGTKGVQSLFEELERNPKKAVLFGPEFIASFVQVKDKFIEQSNLVRHYTDLENKLQAELQETLAKEAELAKMRQRAASSASPEEPSQPATKEEAALSNQAEALRSLLGNLANVKITLPKDQIEAGKNILVKGLDAAFKLGAAQIEAGLKNARDQAALTVARSVSSLFTGAEAARYEGKLRLQEINIRLKAIDINIETIKSQERLAAEISYNSAVVAFNSATREKDQDKIQQAGSQLKAAEMYRNYVSGVPTKTDPNQSPAEERRLERQAGIGISEADAALLKARTQAFQGRLAEQEAAKSLIRGEREAVKKETDIKVTRGKIEDSRAIEQINQNINQLLTTRLGLETNIAGVTTQQTLEAQAQAEADALRSRQGIEIDAAREELRLRKQNKEVSEEEIKKQEKIVELIEQKHGAESRVQGLQARQRQLDHELLILQKTFELEKSNRDLSFAGNQTALTFTKTQIANRQQLLGIDQDIVAKENYRIELLEIELDMQKRIQDSRLEGQKKIDELTKRKQNTQDANLAAELDREIERQTTLNNNSIKTLENEKTSRRNIAGLTRDQQTEQGNLLETQKRITRQVELTAFVQNSYIDMIKELAPLKAAELAYEQKLLEISSQDLAKRQKIVESVEQAQDALAAYGYELSAEELKRYELQKKQGEEQLARLNKEAAHQKQLALLEKQKSDFLSGQLKVREQMQHQQNLENAMLEKTLATLKLTETSQVRLRDLQQRRNIDLDYEIKRKQFLEVDEQNREKLGKTLTNLQQAQTKAGETLDIVGEDGSSTKISRSQASSEVERIKGLLAKDTTTEGLRALELERDRRLATLNIETEKSKILASQNEQREQLNRSLDLETVKLDALLAKYQFSETMQVRLRTESQRRRLEQQYLSEDRLAEEARAREVAPLEAQQQSIRVKYSSTMIAPTDADVKKYSELQLKIDAINAAFITTRKENTALLEQEIEKLTIQEQTQLRQAKFNELLERTASIAEGLKGSFGSLGDRLGEFVTSLGAFTSTQTRNAETLAQSQGLIKQGFKERLEIEKELDVLSRKPGSQENEDAIITAQTKLAAVKSKNKKLAEEDDKLRRKSLSEELAGAEKLAGNAKKLFKEKTAAHKAFHAVEKVIHIARLGMAAVQMAMDIKAAVLSTSTTGIQVANDATKASSGGVTAVINAVKDLGFPLNLIAGAATIAFIASILGSAFGGKSKAPSTFIPTAEQAQEVQGTAMGFDSQGNKVQVRRGVFGDTDAKSDSIRKGIETITKNSVIGLSYNNQMLETLRSIDRSIGSAARGLYSIPGLRTGSLFGTQEGKTGSGGWLLGKSSTQTDIIDSGIKLTGSFTQLADSAVDFIKVFETVKVTSSRSGFLGGLLDGILGGGGTETSTSIRERELNSSELGIARDIQNIFSSGIKFFEDIAARVGMSSGSVRTVLAGMDITQRTASLRGLKGDELQKEFGTVVSTIFDDASLALFASFKEFERFGETLTDTVIRVVDTNEKINQQLRNLGLTNQDALKELDNKATEKIVENFGDLETFISKTNYFFENFLTEEQRLMQTRKAVTEEFTRLGIAMPKTREEFANLVQTTDADSPLFLALMNLSEGFDQVQMAADQAAERVTDFDRKLKDLDPTRSSLDKLLDDLVLELGRFFKDQSLDTTKVIMFGLKSAKNILGSEIKQLYKTRKDEINASITELTNIKTKLTELRNTLIVGPLSNLTPGQQFLELQSRYKSTLADLQSSDKTKQAKAAEKFPGLAQEYLTSAQSLYASSSTFQNIRNLVLADLAAATTQIDSSLSIQERELNALETTIPQALKDIETNTANLDHITGLVNMYTAFNTAITALPSGLAAAVQAIRGGDVQTIIDTVLIALKLKEPPPPAADTGNTGNTGNTGSTAALPAVSTKTEAEIADYWNNTVGKILLPHEKMKALASYMSTHNISHSQIAKVFGIPESMVTSYLDLQDNLEIGRRLLEEVSDLSTENDNFTRNMLKTLGDINDQYVTRYLNDYDRYIDRWPELFNDTYYQNQLEQRYPNVVPMAKGGLTSPGLTLVGEEGPELVDFKTPGRVYTANQTKDLLDYPESLQYNLQYNLNKNMLDKLDKLLEAVNNGAIVNVAATKQNTEEIVEAIVDSNNKAIQANKLQQKIIIK